MVIISRMVMQPNRSSRMDPYQFWGTMAVSLANMGTVPGHHDTHKRGVALELVKEFGRRAARLVVYSIPGLFDAFVTKMRFQQGSSRRKGRVDTNERVTAMIRSRHSL